MALAKSRYRRQYLNKSPRQLARWITWLSRGCAALLAAVMMLSFFSVLALLDMISGRPNSGSSVRSARQLLLGTSAITFIVIVVLGVLFLSWVYRISANAHAMGAEGLHFGAGSSVALFFVPVLNILLVPFMMDELWRAGLSVTDWKKQEHGRLVLVWWLLMLATVIGGVLMIHTGRGKTPRLAEHIFIWQMAYIAVTMPFYFVLPELVNNISTNLRRQMRVGSRYSKRLDLLEKGAVTETVVTPAAALGAPET